MQKNTIFIITILFSLCSFSQKYPVTKKIATTVTKHNISYQDDYSWLENMNSEEVTNWTNAQNEVTNKHFKEIKKSISPDLSTVLKEYDTKTTYRIAPKRGRYYYTLYRNSNKKASSLYFMENYDSKALEIINPNLIYPDKNVSIVSYYPSEESKTLAYKISIDGSEKQEMRFYDLSTGKTSDEVLHDIKFSRPSWNNDEGVFYNRNNNKEQFAKDSTNQVFYHKVGTRQEDDRLVFDGSKTQSTLHFFTKKDKLFITEENRDNTSRNYYSADLAGGEFHLEKFIENDTTDFKLLTYRNKRVYFSSPDYNWGEIRSYELQDKKKDSVTIPQIYNNLLVRSAMYDDYIVCKYKTVTGIYLNVYDYMGKLIRQVIAPDGTDVEIMDFDNKTKELYYGFYSYVLPYQNFKLNIISGVDWPFYSRANQVRPTLFPRDHFVTKNITYKSRDGEDIPITIVYKKGLKLDGNNPTLLRAYGGFGEVNTPYYNIGLVSFIEKGGVFAYANIRGGGIKGEKWHKDGMGLKKENTFKDFIDAAEYLISEKYTSPNRLAITGAAQGGLVVGVAMTRRPELFKVVISTMGALDMLQFGKYTVGQYLYKEYGNPDNEKDYKALLGYSPLHNIKEDINYPTTLLITSDNDERVAPMHSYKFAAKLQNRPAQKNPIYLQTLRKAGHGGVSTSYDDSINEEAEFFGFLWYHLNL